MKSLILSTILSTIVLSAAAQTDNDSIRLADASSPLMPTKSVYTLTLRNVQLNGQNQTATLKLRIGSNASGADITFGDKSITLANAKDTIQLADMLVDGLNKHDFTITKSSRITVYRDGVLLGSLGYSNYRDEARIVLDHISALKAGYELELTADGTNEVPSQEPYETNIGGMLADFTNLATDPYFNSGLARTGNHADKREQNFLNSYNGGEGSHIWADASNAYSGPFCIGLSSSEDNENTTLEQTVTLKANVPYVVRAMIKSNGWEGRLGIKGEENAIHIKDTNGEWKQFEGVLSSQNAASVIELAHEDGLKDGTVYIDNLEVYEGSNGISGIANNKAVMVSVTAGNIWNPSNETEVYRLQLTETSAEKYAQINPEKVHITGAPIFKRSFTGSKMEAIYLPYAVTNVTVSGKWDYRDFYEYPLYNGLDFVMQRFNTTTGKFEYLNDDEDLTPGAYIIQVADNYDGQTLKFDFDPSRPDTPSSEEINYHIAGNGSCADDTNEIDAWHEYHFNADKELFDSTGSIGSQPGKTRPFLYYIFSLAQDAPTVIAPDGVNGIQRLTAAQGGEAFVIRPAIDGATIISRTRGLLPIYNLAGMQVQKATIEAGENHIQLPAGFYIIGGKKLIVK